MQDAEIAQHLVSLEALSNAIFAIGELERPEGTPEIFSQCRRVVVGARVRELLELFVLQRAREGVEDLLGLDVAICINVLTRHHIAVSWADHDDFVQLSGRDGISFNGL